MSNYYGMPPWVEEHAETIKVDAVPWDAEEAYQVYGNGEPGRDFLLYYDNCVVEVGFVSSRALTDDRMAAVGEKPGGGPVFV